MQASRVKSFDPPPVPGARRDVDVGRASYSILFDKADGWELTNLSCRLQKITHVCCTIKSDKAPQSAGRHMPKGEG